MRLKGMITAILLCLATVDLMAQQLTEKESLNRALQYLESNRILSGSVRMTAQVRDGVCFQYQWRRLHNSFG